MSFHPVGVSGATMRLLRQVDATKTAELQNTVSRNEDMNRATEFAMSPMSPEPITLNPTLVKGVQHKNHPSTSPMLRAAIRASAPGLSAQKDRTSRHQGLIRWVFYVLLLCMTYYCHFEILILPRSLN